jgi:glycosyltransferase involved in cell wall biosynthesis
VIERIGYFDEEKYPRGYGEENDYAFRAAKAGFTLRLADHCYVYHAGSRSFTPEGRLDLIHQNRPALVADWGEAIARAQDQIKEDDSLDGLRRRLGEWTYQIGFARSGDRSLRILYLLPEIAEGTSGGAHMVVDSVAALRALGVEAQVAVKYDCVPLFLQTYPDCRECFLPYRSEDELASQATAYDVLVMTHFRTTRLAGRLRVGSSQLIAYYVQDYEPRIATNDEERAWAFESYTLLPDAVPFAMASWIADTVRAETGVRVHRVEAGFREQWFQAAEKPPPEAVTVSAMVRPRTPRRGPERTVRVLKRLKQEFGDRVRIVVFGCDPKHPLLPQELAGVHYESRGILSRQDTARLLCQSDVFLDCSHYQAYGLTAVEAMSCGCVPVVPLAGGAGSYGVNGHNCLIVDTSDDNAVLQAGARLVSDEALRRRLSRNGRRTAGHMSLRNLALSTYLLLWKEHRGRLGARAAASEKQVQVGPASVRPTSPPEEEARYKQELAEVPARPALLFVLPNVRPGGGGHSVTHAVAAMRQLELPSAVAAPARDAEAARRLYPEVMDAFLFYRDSAELERLAQRSSVFIATLFTTMPLAMRLANLGPRGMAAYYIQDYEPYFLDYPPADLVGDLRTRALRAAAVASYTLDPSAVLFAKTDWLCREVERETGAQVDRVEAGIDLDMFGPGQSQSGPVNVCAMIRPYSGYRAPELTMRLLKRLKQCFGDAVHPIVFGCDPEDPAFLTYERDFDHESVGVVGREGVAGVFARSHVFIDASAWQGFGRTGVEAMAAGCVPVVPLRGGCVDYAVDGENSLVVDTRDENAIFRAASRLITDQSYRQQLACNGLQTARRYTMGKNALSIYVLLARRYWERFGEG